MMVLRNWPRSLGFARQQWRAWIETPTFFTLWGKSKGFARQQWRAWIETIGYLSTVGLITRIRPPAMAGVD